MEYRPHTTHRARTVPLDGDEPLRAVSVRFADGWLLVEEHGAVRRLPAVPDA